MKDHKKALTLLYLTLLNIHLGMPRSLRGGIDFTDCGSKYQIYFIEISSCDAIPCLVEKGHLITINMEMTPKDYSIDLSEMLIFDAYWLVGGTQYNAMIIPEYCRLGDCLNIRSNKLSFSVLFYVSEKMPAFSTGAFIWRNIDYKTSEILSCSRIPISIN